MKSSPISPSESVSGLLFELDSRGLRSRRSHAPDCKLPQHGGLALYLSVRVALIPATTVVHPHEQNTTRPLEDIRLVLPDQTPP